MAYLFVLVIILCLFAAAWIYFILAAVDRVKRRQEDVPTKRAYFFAALKGFGLGGAVVLAASALIGLLFYAALLLAAYR